MLRVSLNELYKMMGPAHINFVVLTTITFEPKPKNTTGTLLLKPYLKLSDAGKYCYPVDIVRSTGADLREGDNATILIEYSAGDGYLYQVSCSFIFVISVPDLTFKVR